MYYNSCVLDSMLGQMLRSFWLVLLFSLFLPLSAFVPAWINFPGIKPPQTLTHGCGLGRAHAFCRRPLLLGLRMLLRDDENKKDGFSGEFQSQSGSKLGEARVDRSEERRRYRSNGTQGSQRYNDDASDSKRNAMVDGKRTWKR